MKDDLDALRGIVFGMIFALVIWALVAGAAWELIG